MEDKRKDINLEEDNALQEVGTNLELKKTQALADEARVKVMSPSMLVFKRFIRNRLAVVGFIILAVMFLFSFVGPIFTPYTQEQQFQIHDMEYDTYAQFKVANDFIFYASSESTVKDSTAVQAMCNAQAMIVTQPLTWLSTVQQYDAAKREFFAEKIDSGSVRIISLNPVATYTSVNGGALTYESGENLEADLLNAVTAQSAQFSTNPSGGGAKFQYQSTAAGAQMQEYLIVVRKAAEKSTVTIGTPITEGISSVLQFHDVKEGNSATMSAEDKAAIINRYYSSTAVTGYYVCGEKNANGEMMVQKGGEDFVVVSNYVLNPKQSEHLGIELKSFLASKANELTAANEKEEEVVYTDANGNETSYKIKLVEDSYTATTKLYDIEKKLPVSELDIAAAPSGKHLLGTDKYAMDVMTRLMYGGRVSLLVGFVVVAIEIFIGIIVGGIAGYFSGWVDVIIMRFIELFNCIPFYPMMLIIGNIMDARQVGSTVRIMLLMALLGLLNWPGIARIVRGQILSLREQDFIVATEACGIPVSRRIFKHLIPNVTPLLIVNATMSLGGIIITEATLSFLGLGVKFPAASWGSIINQAQDGFVLRSYPWIWIPAGLLILLTVLGFNFVGDGLRDAFDPKMKR